MFPTKKMLSSVSVFGLTVFLTTGCSNFEKDKNKDDSDSSQSAGVSSGTIAVSDQGGFAIQPAVELSSEGLAQSIQWRLMAKLEELQIATKFVSEDRKEQTSTALKLLADQDPQDNGEEDANFDEKFAEFVDNVKRLLNEKIIVEANIVEKLENSVTYKVEAASFCNDSEDNFPASPEEVAQKQADFDSCVNLINKLEVKVRFSSPDSDTITIEPLLGPNAAAPIRFSASSSMLGLTLNPVAMPEVISIIDANSGEASKISITNPWSGDLSLRLTKIADGKYAVTAESQAGISAKALVIERKMSLLLASSPNLATLVIDSNARTFELAVNLGGLDIAVPMELMADDESITEAQKSQMQSMELHLESISGDLLVDPKNSTATLTDLTLSAQPYSLSHNGKSIVEVTFPTVQKISAVLTGIADANRIELSTGFMVKAKLKLLEIQSLVNEVPSEFLDETISLEVAGTTPVLTDHDTYLEVTNGSLILSSAGQAKTVTAMAGQCIEAQDSENTLWIDALIVSACVN